MADCPCGRLYCMPFFGDEANPPLYCLRACSAGLNRRSLQCSECAHFFTFLLGKTESCPHCLTLTREERMDEKKRLIKARALRKIPPRNSALRQCSRCSHHDLFLGGECGACDRAHLSQTPLAYINRTKTVSQLEAHCKLCGRLTQVRSDSRHCQLCHRQCSK